jgi:hypothetical protein
MINCGTYGPDIPGLTASVEATFKSQGGSWIWAQGGQGYPAPSASAVADWVGSGRKLILRTYFWDLFGSTRIGWSALREVPGRYDTIMAEINREVGQFGAANLDYLTLGEEEPASGYGFRQSVLTMQEKADYIYGINLLYDRVKAAYPNIKVMATNHWVIAFGVNYLTDAEFLAVKMDALMVYNYYGNDPHYSYQAYLTRGYNLGVQKGLSPNEIFTLVYGGGVEDPTTTPAYIRADFELRISLGYKNIGFFSGDGMPHNLLFGTYAAGTYEALNKQGMLDLIAGYGVPVSLTVSDGIKFSDSADISIGGTLPLSLSDGMKLSDSAILTKVLDYISISDGVKFSDAAVMEPLESPVVPLELSISDGMVLNDLTEMIIRERVTIIVRADEGTIRIVTGSRQWDIKINEKTLTVFANKKEIDLVE